MIITRTPFRISFFGGGTDFPEFYQEHGGLVLSTAIQRYCFISLHQLSPLFQYRFRASYSRTEKVQEPSEFEHPLIRECLLECEQANGLEITHFSDLPGQTGLGSSSSFTVGLLHALETLKNNVPTSGSLATRAIDIERARVGDAGGHQDQYAAAFGGINLIHFGPGSNMRVEPLSIDAARMQTLEDSLMLFYMGTEQSAMDILAHQTRNVERNHADLLSLKEMAQQGHDLLTGSSSMDEFGKFLHDAWTLKKSLAEGISNPTIDQAYQTARDCGAIGGKLLGAGGRGFLLLYAGPTCQPAIRDALAPLKEVDIGLAAEGSQVIYQDETK